MSENHRGPEVPEARVPVVECLDGPARITSKELAPIHSVKSGTLQSACSTGPRVVADLGNSALLRIARLKNSLAIGYILDYESPRKHASSIVARNALR